MYSLNRILLALAAPMCAGLVLTASVRAQPGAPAPRAADAGTEQATDTEPPAEAAAPDESQVGRSREERERLRRLLGDRPAAESPAENPLDRAVRGMRSAHERIADRDISDETRAIQRQVIEDLAKLIDLARQPPPPRNNPPPEASPEDQPQDPADQQSEPQTSESEDQQQANGTQEQQQQQRRQSDQARESSERERQAELRKAELERRRNLVDGVWGHLPPAVRNRILSGSGDEYLQDYEHLARRYFEALAEQSARER